MSGWWQPRTLRFRLALWYAVCGTVLLAAYSGALYFFIARELPVEARLRRDAAIVRAHATVLPDGSVAWDGRPIGPPETWSREKPWFELWNGEGRLVLRRWPFAEHALENPLSPPAPGRDVVSIYSVASDLRLRLLALPFAGPAGQPWMLRIMRVHEPATDILAAFRIILLAMLPLVIALLVAGGYALTRYWLRPFDEMAKEVDRIGVDDLSRRVTVPRGTEEIGRVATVFNLTLERLEDAFVALDRFVADASHELRTPLNALSNVGEVGLGRSRTAEEYREIIGSMLEEAERLKLLTQRLLDLARIEGGAEQAHRRPIQLEAEVGACLEEMSILAEARNQRLILTVEPCRVETDPVIFRQALRNVLDNAIKYSPEGSTIGVTVKQSGGDGSVAVADEGPGIAPADQAQIARRFFRADNARTRSGGFGLGLAITKAHMRMLGGSIEYQARDPVGSIFRLSLPAEASTPRRGS